MKLPLFELLIDLLPSKSQVHLYEQNAIHIFQKLFSDFSWLHEDPQLQASRFHHLLPLLKISSVHQIPSNLSLYFLCPYRPNAFRFFFELLTRWLVPGKRINVELFFAVDLRIPEWGPAIYTMAEVMVRLDTPHDAQVISEHLPTLQRELRLGVSSANLANRILELKGLGSEEKIGGIRNYLHNLLRRKRVAIDWDILSEMQLFLLSCSDTFKSLHEDNYLARLICWHYLFRKALRRLVEEKSDRHHFLVKCTRNRLTSYEHPTIGLLVALNLLGDYELFEERHLLNVVQSFIPEAQFFSGSFLQSSLEHRSSRLLYVDIFKQGGAPFTTQELKRLRKGLPGQMKHHIQTLLHSTFMPRNEEEIMRHMVTLSQELKYVKDLPEVILLLDSQTPQFLTFTVILVRLLSTEAKSLSNELAISKAGFEFRVERTKTMGMLRKKYPKEASVLSVKLHKELFLREDHCVDLYKARQTIFEELVRLLGPLRDFNGGMIAKQGELFTLLKGVLGGVALRHPLLLENFFFALSPPVMRSLLEPKQLKPLFLLLLDTLEESIFEKRGYLIRTETFDRNFLVVISADDPTFIPCVTQAIEALFLPSLSYTFFSLAVQETHCLGYLYSCQELEQQRLFYTTIQSTMEGWKEMALS